MHIRVTTVSNHPRGVKLAMSLAVLAVLAAYYQLRLRDHFANVDDYLYALQTHAYGRGLRAGPAGLADSWRYFGVNTPLIPFLAMPLAIVSTAPDVLVLVQVPVALLLFVGLKRLLTQMGVSDSRAWFGAGLLTVLPAVAQYAVMLHYALASTASLVWVLTTYLASSRLTIRVWALALGVSGGCLAISRVVAPVYLASLAVPIAVHLVVSGKVRGRQVTNLVLAAAVAGVIAVPWWYVTWPQPKNYLLSSGYDSSSGFAGEAGRAWWKLLWQRISVSADQTGWALFFGGLLVGLLAIRRGAKPAVPAAISTVVVGMLVLSTSGNVGTGFALPYLVLAGCVVASWLLRPASQSRLVLARAIAAVVVAVAFLGQLGALAPATVSGHGLWLSSYPAHREAQAAVGAGVDLRLTTQGTRAFAARMRGHRTLVVRDDPVLNINGLWWWADADSHETLAVTTPSYAATAIGEQDLDNQDLVLAGTSRAPFHGRLDADQVTAFLHEHGWHVVYQCRFARGNVARLWSK